MRVVRRGIEAEIVRSAARRCQTGERRSLVFCRVVRAAILAVGSELLSTDRLDTNSLRVTERLERHGVELVRKSAVGDDVAAIAAEIASALAIADLVVVGGGLGPTADDVTREACARALDRELVEDAACWAAIERRFAALGRTPTPNNRRQALLVGGAVALANPHGTAPGQRIDLGGDRAVFLLPGVPYELDGMLASALEPWLAERSPGRGRERRTLLTAARPESEVDAALTPVYARFGRESITVLASAGEVKVRCLASGAEAERRQRLDAMTAAVREALGDSVFGEGEERTLEAAVGEALFRRGRTVATAESCTGGLLAERLTRVAGASRYFPGGVVTYSNEQKTSLLGIPPELLAAHGAVSREVVEAMAAAARRRFATDYALAISGVAGPDGGTASKPVGTVHLALAGPGGEVRHRQTRLLGDRQRVRWLASTLALEQLRRLLLAGEGAA
jgi:nicotinamide-nucleotide amidase